MGGLLYRLQHRELWAAVNSWHSSHLEAKRVRVLLERCFGRILHRALSGAFQAWMEEVRTAFMHVDRDVNTHVNTHVDRDVNTHFHLHF